MNSLLKLKILVLIITPPDDNGQDADEDSGDEECRDPGRLNSHQLLAEVVLIIHSNNEVDNISDSENTASSPTASESRMKSRMVVQTRSWAAGVEQAVSIDESMIPCFGPHECKQFIRGKPVRFDSKAWVMALTAGYCLNFDIYQARLVTELGKLGYGASGTVQYCHLRTVTTYKKKSQSPTQDEENEEECKYDEIEQKDFI
ncbi:hypothetical protein ILUMI_17593 [Ignelater luminosus]|uniref:PiggyBac transposable element-derived protein domain-containing protein n=1 Tax=Ignelater luminosus TaxID=2038154 RepID=A0A8K0CRZ5_IGNLU|nr:hypothetical protein ILUMI_17593 [Ignelater luminosus]